MRNNRGASSSPNNETEHAGCHINANTWIKVGLSKQQAALLKKHSKLFLKPNYRSSARLAWHLVNAALANMEIMAWLLRGCEDWTPEARCKSKAGARLNRLN